MLTVPGWPGEPGDCVQPASAAAIPNATRSDAAVRNARIRPRRAESGGLSQTIGGSVLASPSLLIPCP